MERKLDEIFEYEDTKLKVCKSVKGCCGCYFEGYCYLFDPIEKGLGSCMPDQREDCESVIFREVKGGTKDDTNSK